MQWQLQVGKVTMLYNIPEASHASPRPRRCSSRAHAAITLPRCCRGRATPSTLHNSLRLVEPCCILRKLDRPHQDQRTHHIPPPSTRRKRNAAQLDPLLTFPRSLQRCAAVPHAYVNCMEASTPRAIFDSIINQVSHRHHLRLSLLTPLPPLTISGPFYSLSFRISYLHRPS